MQHGEQKLLTQIFLFVLSATKQTTTEKMICFLSILRCACPVYLNGHVLRGVTLDRFYFWTWATMLIWVEIFLVKTVDALVTSPVVDESFNQLHPLNYIFVSTAFLLLCLCLPSTLLLFLEYLKQRILEMFWSEHSSSCSMDGQKQRCLETMTQSPALAFWVVLTGHDSTTSSGGKTLRTLNDSTSSTLSLVQEINPFHDFFQTISSDIFQSKVMLLSTALMCSLKASIFSVLILSMWSW